MQIVDVRLFQTPRWFQYSMAILATIVAAAWRSRMQGVMAESSPLTVFSFAVAIAAFLGGMGPGLVATALSLGLGIRLFIIPYIPYPTEDLQTSWLISAHATVWLFICTVCDLLRRSALGYRSAASERDEHRERLSTIFDSMSDGFFAVDNDWKVTHCNRAFCRIVGATDEDQIGKSFWMLMGDYRDAVYGPFNGAKGDRSSVAIDVQDPNGVRWYHFRVFPDQFGMSGYIQDASYRKRIEDHNERLLNDEKLARTEAERASHLKDEFIATLSHELRTPLTAILGWAEILRARRGLDDRFIEGLDAIERSTKLQTQLVEELLDMSRISVGKVRLRLELMDLSEVVQEAAGVFRPVAEERDIELAIDCPDYDVLVRGDSSRLHQVFSNLVSNAVKFTPEGGHIRVTLTRLGNDAVVTVRDDGQGIDKSFQPYLFDRFRQANATITRSHGGLGLGLAIARQLVTLHKGKIEAVSEGPGTGSVFTIILPLAECGEEPRPVTTQGSAGRPSNISGLRILVVDDERETRDLLHVVLRDAGAIVQTADSADAALSTFSTFHPEVVISDIGMPEVDGYEFIRRVRQLSRSEGGQVPAAALTAFARDEDRERALEAGFQAHLAKPIEQTLLIRTICELVGQQPTEQPV